VSDTLTIQSHTGPYRVFFHEDALETLNADPPSNAHFIIDARVAELYAGVLGRVLAAPSVLRIEASEPAKSLDRFPGYIEHLVASGVRRGHTLIAIGGGVIQDITCFLAAVLLRGLPWTYYPSTLLAQADSCIGSKSSINVGRIKNILGTFTPPAEIHVSTDLLRTLDAIDVRSGIGEMLKVHAIAGPDVFSRIAADYPVLTTDVGVLKQYIRDSLAIKQTMIEADEFDRGPRNVMNYGHSFGHAIEAATDFAIPHGIAVTMGMDMANYYASKADTTVRPHFERMHPTLASNYVGFEEVPVPLDLLLSALAKDKKNSDTALRLVLPDGDGRIGLTWRAADGTLRAACSEFLATVRRS
jgi:3-dehydroquinate synthase